MLYIRFDLRSVQMDESFGGTFAYKQLRPRHMIWRH